MTTIRPFECGDLFKVGSLRLDGLTKTSGISVYMQFLARCPSLFQVAESPTGEIVGLIVGKMEGKCDDWHGHISELAVVAEYRRLGIANVLMDKLEELFKKTSASFINLYVRVSNSVAIDVFHDLGYTVYHTFLEFYKGDFDEDAYEMKKTIIRNVEDNYFITP